MVAATITNQAEEIVNIAEKFRVSSEAQAAHVQRRENTETQEKAQIETDQSKTTREIVEEYFSDIPIMVDVAYCESRFTQFNNDGSVHRGVINPADVGVMQINEKYHLETSKKLGLNIHTLEGNLDYGRYLYETQGTRPWEYSSHCWNKSREVALN